MSRILITGGAGFIGSALCHQLMQMGSHAVTVVDKLTYAANRASVASLETQSQFRLVVADICDGQALADIFAQAQPEIVFHLAAESHVDRSISGSAPFLHTNITGTHTLLEVARRYFDALPSPRANAFRFVQVSTDEVFGSLGAEGQFTEDSAYDPSSPYSASKAAGDHLAIAWHRTYGLPVLITHCTNNYGPRQFPEKLIPRMITNALNDRPLPVYGDGTNVRDWLHVEDHVDGLIRAAANGIPGRRYNFGGGAEYGNIELVEMLCDLLDEKRPGATSRRDLIRFVEDRPGHDYRYAIDPSRAASELGWQPRWRFEEGLAATVDWYLANETWWAAMIAAEGD